jgi:hypothetical protein
MSSLPSSSSCFSSTGLELAPLEDHPLASCRHQTSLLLAQLPPPPPIALVRRLLHCGVRLRPVRPTKRLVVCDGLLMLVLVLWPGGGRRGEGGGGERRKEGVPEQRSGSDQRRRGEGGGRGRRRGGLRMS